MKYRGWMTGLEPADVGITTHSGQKLNTCVAPLRKFPNSEKSGLIWETGTTPHSLEKIRNSAIHTLAQGVLQSTSVYLKCCHWSSPKRQRISCRLRDATTSLKVGFVVPGFGLPSVFLILNLDFSTDLFRRLVCPAAAAAVSQPLAIHATHCCRPSPWSWVRPWVGNTNPTSHSTPRCARMAVPRVWHTYELFVLILPGAITLCEEMPRR